VIITASAASYFAETGRAWYQTINLPDWTPSGSIMVLAWTIIFVLSSLSLLIIWNKHSSKKNFGVIIVLFVFNALFIVGWNILFFSHQQLGLAFFSGCAIDRQFNSPDLFYLAFISIGCIFTRPIFPLPSFFHCAYF